MNESINLLVPFKEFSSYIFKCRSKLEEILELAIYSLVIFICINALLYFIIHRFRNGTSKFRFCRPVKLPENASRVLLVTAHPDDECMFFGPTLIALRKRRNCRIFVLCLSRGKIAGTYSYHSWFHDDYFTGDFEKQGHIRKDELWDSCRVFNIQPQDITLIHCTQLPDDPNVEWKVELLSQLILQHIEALDIDLLITFDKDGVSQHKNHTAIYYATASLCLSGLMPSSCKILVLETVNVIRKYLSLFDVVISLLLSTNWWVNMKTVMWASLNWTLIPKVNIKVARAPHNPISNVSTQIPNGVVPQTLHNLFTLHAHQFPQRAQFGVDWVRHSRVVDSRPSGKSCSVNKVLHDARDSKALAQKKILDRLNFFETENLVDVKNDKKKIWIKMQLTKYLFDKKAEKLPRDFSSFVTSLIMIDALFCSTVDCCAFDCVKMIVRQNKVQRQRRNSIEFVSVKIMSASPRLSFTCSPVNAQKITMELE